MVINNKTTFKKETIRNIMRADGFDNKSYKTKKAVLNMSGLVSGMVCVSILSRSLYSGEGAYKFWAAIFGIICAFCLFAGMYGIDKKNYIKFAQNYSCMIGNTYLYEIDSDEILVRCESGSSDNENDGGKPRRILWQQVEKWCEDLDSIYLFLRDDDGTFDCAKCEVLDKKGFTGCEANDLKELCGAVMAAREYENKRQEK